jgi:predicted phosphate transport protein (TIGR00153 family)
MIWFMPKDENFFELFERAAGNAHLAAEVFIEFLEKFDDLEERAKRIKDIEHAGDKITHDTLDRLARTFITPIDREDIHTLVSRLDDIVDLIDTAVNRMVIYRVGKPRPEALGLARCLRHATGIIRDAMPLLRDMKNGRLIHEKCIDIQTQENEADRVMQQALAELFGKTTDPIEIIKWKDVYGDLESATDSCQDVANVIESIVIRHS